MQLIAIKTSNLYSVYWTLPSPLSSPENKAVHRSHQIDYCKPAAHLAEENDGHRNRLWCMQQKHLNSAGSCLAAVSPA